jgi:predicted nucleic acid-binding protein
MAATLFLDTSFVIALINKRDEFHGQAVKLSLEFGDYPLVTTDAVLFEIGNALARAYKDEAIGILESFLHDTNVEIINCHRALFIDAFTHYKKYSDKEWGLVDCLSFVVMKKHNITQALTADNHFTQAGFKVLMNTK